MLDLLNDYPLVLNVSDVAEILGIAPYTVRKLMRTGALPAKRVGNRFKITKNKLCEYLEETK